jgi:hypothetical protein
MPTSQVERRKTEREGREVAISSVLSEVEDSELILTDKVFFTFFCFVDRLSKPHNRQAVF